VESAAQAYGGLGPKKPVFHAQQNRTDTRHQSIGKNRRFQAIFSQIKAKLAGALIFFKKQAPPKKGFAERELIPATMSTVREPSLPT